MINLKNVKKQTVALLLLVATGTATLQIEWVKDKIVPLLANHPHWSSIGTGLIFAIGLLHSPLAIKVLESFTSEEETQHPDGATTTTKVEVTKIEETPTP